jgi:hypothetical protein
LHIARFLLSGDQIVAVQVEAKMIDPPVNRPRLAMFQRGAVGIADGDGVVPGDESFVAVGIFTDQDQRHRIFERIERRLVVGGGEVIDHLHHRFERGRFVPVDRVCHPAHHR